MQGRQPYKFFIGIDPGTKTGFAHWDKEQKKLTHCKTMLIHNALELTKAWICDRKLTLVRVEDPRLAVFGRQNDMYKAQGAGSVKRDAAIWEDFLTEFKFNFEMVRPNKALTKTKEDVFRKITGWSQKTSEHARDAAMLVFGF